MVVRERERVEVGVEVRVEVGVLVSVGGSVAIRVGRCGAVEVGVGIGEVVGEEEGESTLLLLAVADTNSCSEEMGVGVEVRIGVSV